MARLFVAVRPPEPVRDTLLGAMGGISGARWQDDDQLHLTLRFIGDVDRRVADDIVVTLAGVRHPAIEASIGGVGSFANRGRPNAVWAGVGPVEALSALHLKVDQAIASAGVPRDGRAFHPHITLARLNRGLGEIAGFVAATLIATRFTITGFGLFESILARDRATYREVEHIEFAALR